MDDLRQDLERKNGRRNDHTSSSAILHLLHCYINISFLSPFLSPDRHAIILSANMSCPSLVFLRKLKIWHIPLSQQCSRQFPIETRRALHTSSRCFSNQEKTFRGQLYESTARRIQAQREAEARFAATTPLSSFARNSAFTFCTHASVAETFTADFCSNPLLVRPSLLVRKHETRQGVAIVYRTSTVYGSERTEAQYFAYKS